MQIVIKAVDEASATLGKIGGSIKAMEPVFKRMAVAGTVALGAVSALAVKSIKEYADAEKAQAMLEHAVVGVTHATQDQYKATSDLAEALSKKGVLDGDDIKQGLAQLSTFGLSNKAVQALGGSLADLAVNQFGVTASGEQLGDSANMIAKALNGQFGVLEKSGIRFTDAQKHVIQFGTEMEKVDAINQGFAQNLKYTNEVALKTTEGQMAAAGVAVRNLSEALGGILDPIVKEVLANVTPLITKMQTWIDANPELTKRLIIAAAAVSVMLVVVGSLGLALPVLGTAIAFLASPIGLIVIAFAALTAAGVYVFLNWEKMTGGLKNLMDNFDKSTGLVTQLKNAYNEISALIATSVKPAFDNFMKTLQPYMPALEALGKLILGVIVVGLKLTVEVVKDLILLFLNITTKVLEISAALNEFFTPAANTAKGIIDSISNAITTVISRFDSMKASAEAAFSAASRVAVGVATGGMSEVARAIMPKMASGGIVTSPTIAMIGEAGPEAVIPLGKGGGLGTSVNISIGTFFGGDPERAAREMGDLIIKRLQLNARVA